MTISISSDVKMTIIYQHTSFKPSSRLRRSLGLRTVGDMPLSRLRLDVPFLISFMIALSNPNDFYARQHICYTAYMPHQFRLSVCPSVTRVLCVKTAERIIEILSPSDRPIILVFRHQGSMRKLTTSPPNGGAKYKGGSDFRPICGYISETVRDKEA